MSENYPADSPFISMLSDYGFKATFGNQHHTLFLRRALQALIGSAVPIAEVTFEQTTFEGTTLGSRSGLYDLACTDAEGTYFLVEMQVSRFPEFLQRMKFYAFTKFNTLIRRGNFQFEQLPRIYSIGILQHGIFPTVPGYHQHLNLRNAQGELLDSQLHFITIELDKFDERAPVTTDLEKLLYLMKTLHKTLPSEDMPLFYREQWIKEAIEELDRSALTAEQRMLLEWDIVREASAIHIQKADLAAARETALREGKAEGLERGKAEGLERGKAEGLERGKAEGLERGKAEGLEKGKAEGKAEGEQEVIRLMLRNSALSVAEIAHYTGRPVAYIEQVKAQL